MSLPNKTVNNSRDYSKSNSSSSSQNFTKFSNLPGSENSAILEISFSKKCRNFLKENFRLIFPLFFIFVFVLILLVILICKTYYPMTNKTDQSLMPINATASQTNLSIELDVNDIKYTIEKSEKVNHETRVKKHFPSIKKSPWEVRFVYKSEDLDNSSKLYNCIGSIVGYDLIITAAHCLLSEIIEIHIGGSHENNYADMIIISADEFSTIIHPEFKYGNFKNIADIGKIKLKNPLKYSKHVYPIFLPIGVQTLPKEYTMNVFTSYEIFNMNKTEKTVTFVRSDECRMIYKTKGKKHLKFYNKKRQNIFCVHSDDYIPQGNSGTPAYIEIEGITFMYGILSLGGSIKQNLPAIFVDVRFYLDWILVN